MFQVKLSFNKQLLTNAIVFRVEYKIRKCAKRSQEKIKVLFYQQNNS